MNRKPRGARAREKGHVPEPKPEVHEIAQAFALKVQSLSLTDEEKDKLLRIVADINAALLNNEEEAVTALMQTFQRETVGLKPKKERKPK